MRIPERESAGVSARGSGGRRAAGHRTAGRGMFQGRAAGRPQWRSRRAQPPQLLSGSPEAGRSMAAGVAGPAGRRRVSQGLSGTADGRQAIESPPAGEDRGAGAAGQRFGEFASVSLGDLLRCLVSLSFQPSIVSTFGPKQVLGDTKLHLLQDRQLAADRIVVLIKRVLILAKHSPKRKFSRAEG